MFWRLNDHGGIGRLKTIMWSSLMRFRGLRISFHTIEPGDGRPFLATSCCATNVPFTAASFGCDSSGNNNGIEFILLFEGELVVVSSQNAPKGLRSGLDDTVSYITTKSHNEHG